MVQLFLGSLFFVVLPALLAFGSCFLLRSLRLRSGKTEGEKANLHFWLACLMVFIVLENLLFFLLPLI